MALTPTPEQEQATIDAHGGLKDSWQGKQGEGLIITNDGTYIRSRHKNNDDRVYVEIGNLRDSNIPDNLSAAEIEKKMEAFDKQWDAARGDINLQADAIAGLYKGGAHYKAVAPETAEIEAVKHFNAEHHIVVPGQGTADTTEIKAVKKWNAEHHIMLHSEEGTAKSGGHISGAAHNVKSSMRDEVGQELQLVLAKAGFTKHNGAFGDDGVVEGGTRQDAKESGGHYINGNGTLNKEAIREAFKKEFGEHATVAVAESSLQKPHYQHGSIDHATGKSGPDRA